MIEAVNFTRRDMEKLKLESQNVEYKESWHDDYLKWICGFANAQGGHIFIGVDDEGNVTGIEDGKKLLEDIPNKVRDTIGIVVDVNLHRKNGRHYIDVAIRPSGDPVNYKGEYHYRSGSTKQLLKGAALTRFLIEKTGFHWDSVPVEGVSPSDLDSYAFEVFRREAVKSGRMAVEDAALSDMELLEKLGLVSEGRFSRAAVLLFHRNPQKFIVGSYVKIGKFGEGPDLQYQDTMEGALFRTADGIIDLIFTKYLKAAITYEHDVRVERYPFPREAVREAVYNALVHNNYARGVPIQIRIEDRTMYIGNECLLPMNWTVATIKGKHRSIPFNPSIAGAFYRAGYVEAWGRGIEKICDACKAYGLPPPEFTSLGTDLTVVFKAHPEATDVNAGLDVGKGKPKTSQNVIPKLQGEVLDEVLVTEIKSTPKVNQTELAKRLKVSLSSIQRAVVRLKSLGRIARVGGKRSGHWEIVK